MWGSRHVGEPRLEDDCVVPLGAFERFKFLGRPEDYDALVDLVGLVLVVAEDLKAGGVFEHGDPSAGGLLAWVAELFVERGLRVGGEWSEERPALFLARDYEAERGDRDERDGERGDRHERGGERVVVVVVVPRR